MAHRILRLWRYLLAPFTLLLPFIAAAQPVPVGGATVTIPNPLGAGATIASILNNIVNFLLAVAGPIAVLVVIIAGVMFLTAGGSQERLGQAKRAMWWAVIGIAILLLSKGIVAIIQSLLRG